EAVSLLECPRNIEEKIKWGDGFAVVYSVTDRCSFDEVMRLCFLINHLHASPKRGGAAEQPPVVIVGNKKDLQFDRMVSTEDGENLSKALKIPFYEISTRDSYEEPVAVFSSLYQELLREGGHGVGSPLNYALAPCALLAPSISKSSRTHPDTPSPPTAPRGASWCCLCLSKGFPSNGGIH
uniref:small monomeric GTPase n=1 Tax=Malurus cyaneus samueli TaxID=2593467 RepID=A0A8C5UMK4_9PASS